MNTAAVQIDPASGPMRFFWVPQDPSTQFYVYMHFAELQQLKANESRAFNITFNGDLLYGPVSPEYLFTNTIYTTSSLSSKNMTFALVPIENSTMPPILNAIEVFSLMDFSKPETDQGDGKFFLTHVSLLL